ncbi:Ig-like domain-containing protein [Mycolicibacterium neoaurum]|uniref:beta strand repeat-containing protein n=1 Tax=Mycolicibacterium neoaurum TaxID=1795 RepID=UPI002671F2C7|nr:Ig-like domain-containing protein [Mycolicibacterium neoaurum]MDO3401529.1 Ig-like domain-containing protein [Mycolicibacterium neoaurum]
MKHERADISRHDLVHRHAGTGLDYESFARWLRVGAVAFALGASAFAAPAVAMADTSDSGASSSSASSSSSGESSAGDDRSESRGSASASSATGSSTEPESPKQPNGRDSATGLDGLDDDADDTADDTDTDTGAPDDADNELAEQEPSDGELTEPGETDGTEVSPGGNGSGSGESTAPTVPPAVEVPGTGTGGGGHTQNAPAGSPTTTSPATVESTATPRVSGQSTGGGLTQPQSSATTTVAPIALRSAAAVTTSGASTTAVAAAAPTVIRQATDVTLQSIFTDIMHWIGLGSLSANLPVPPSPVPMFVESLWLFVRNINYTLNNQRPTAAPTTSGPGAGGTITGSVNGSDYDDTNLTYTVSAGAAHGTVTVDANGNFVYTPNAGTNALFDTFTVTVDDKSGNAPHRAGLLDLFANDSAYDTIVNVSLTGAPLPTAGRQSAQVTLGSMISDAMHWVGLGWLANRLPLPAIAMPEPVVSMWNVVRNFQYTWNNQRATVNPVVLGQAADGTITGSLNAVDYDDAAPVYTVAGQPKNGVVTVDANGNFTYTPNAQTAALGGNDQFSVIVNDIIGTPTHFRGLFGLLGWLGPRETTIVVHVNPILPSSAGNGYTANGSDPTTGSTSGSVTVNNPANGTLTYTLGTGAPTRGTVTIDPTTGAFTYTPTEEARHAAAADGASAADKLDTFSVTVTDGYNTFTVPVSLNILPNNANPTVGAPGTTITNPSNGAVTGAVSVADADGDTPRFTGPATSTKGGTVTVDATTGAYTYTPTTAIRHAAAANGATTADQTDTFTITVSDGHGGTIEVPVTVGISSFNTNPTAGTPTVTNVNGGSGVVSGSVGSATDADGDTPRYSGPATSTKGGTVTVDATTGAYTYTPTAAIRHAAAANGATTADQTDTFTITVSDGHGGTVEVPVSVSIVAANTAPVAGATVTGLSHTTGTATGSITGSDSDGDTTVFGGSTLSTKGGTVTIDAATGAFVYTPTAAARHAAAALGASGSDLVDSFTATVSDGYGGTTSVVVVIALSATNTGPTSGSATVGSPSGPAGTVTGTVSIVDPDNDVPSYSAPALSTKGGTVTIDPSTGTYVYTPSAAVRHAAAANGATTADQTDTFTITVSDGHGGTIEVPVTVQVSGSNTAPSVSTSVGNPSGPGGSVSGTVNVTDSDNDATVITAPTLSAKGGTVTVDPTTGAFTYTPTAAIRHAAATTGADRTDTFTITVDDGHGGTTTLAVTVDIDPTNTAPTVTATIGNPSGTQGTVTGTLNITDNDNDTPVITGPLTSTKGGTVTIDPTTGAFTYTPTAAIRHAAATTGAPASAGKDTFDLTVDDGHGGTMVVTILVDVDPANSTPTAAVNVNTPNASNGNVTGSIVVTDADQDTPVFSGSTTTALGGTVTVNTTTGTFSYTPTAAARHNAAAANAPASALNDTFNVTISDGHGGTLVVPVSVTISPSNTAPTGTASINTFPNGDFSNSLTGWTAIDGRVKLGGAGTVAGWPTPVDPTRAPDGGIESTGGTGTYTTTVTNGRAVMVSELSGVSNTPAGSGGVVHGPVVVSNNPLAIYAGATVQFDWEASGGWDAFDVVGYIVDVDTGRTEIMLNATGANAQTVQPVTVVNYLVNTTGNYRFVFVSGTWDATRGEAAGARLSIDNVKVLNNNNPTGVVNGSVTGSDANGDTLTYTGPGSTGKGTVILDSATGSFSYTPTAAARAAATAAGASAADQSDTFIVMLDDGHGGLTPVSVTVPIT